MKQTGVLLITLLILNNSFAQSTVPSSSLNYGGSGLISSVYASADGRTLKLHYIYAGNFSYDYTWQLTTGINSLSMTDNSKGYNKAYSPDLNNAYWYGTPSGKSNFVINLTRREPYRVPYHFNDGRTVDTILYQDRQYGYNNEHYPVGITDSGLLLATRAKDWSKTSGPQRLQGLYLLNPLTKERKELTGEDIYAKAKGEYAGYTVSKGQQLFASYHNLYQQPLQLFTLGVDNGMLHRFTAPVTEATTFLSGEHSLLIGGPKDAVSHRQMLYWYAADGSLLAKDSMPAAGWGNTYIFYGDKLYLYQNNSFALQELAAGEGHFSVTHTSALEIKGLPVIGATYYHPLVLNDRQWMLLPAGVYPEGDTAANYIRAGFDNTAYVISLSSGKAEYAYTALNYGGNAVPGDPYAARYNQAAAQVQARVDAYAAGTCPRCKGSGVIYDVSYTLGIILLPDNKYKYDLANPVPHAEKKKCPVCNGTGRIK